jgi:hypothetical protein
MSNSAIDSSRANLQSAIRHPQVLAWQGWQLNLPSRWNPTKIEGGYDSGSVMIADLHRPRLGVRWKRASPNLDKPKWARKAMVAEVGQLAADEAKSIDLPGQWEASTLYTEPSPPGRDVWVGYSPSSGRCIEIVHHAHRRETTLAQTILPTLRDLPMDAPMPWSIFDLHCVAPAGMKLASHRLNAGDLGLTFDDHRRLVTVRQIALAAMALKRLPPERWLDDQEQRRNKHYRVVDAVHEIECSGDEVTLSGICRTMRRRRRFFFLRAMPRELVTALFHDKTRDRLVIVQGSDEDLVRECAACCCSRGTPGEAG